MIEALDEITEIPFEVFWNKFMDLYPGIYDQFTTEVYWVKMREANRILAFHYKEPWKHLQHFDLPF